MNQPTHLPSANELSALEALRLLDSLAPPPALEARLLDDLHELLLGVLKIAPEDFSPTQPLMDYGLDSIASTEIGTLFTRQFGITVPPTVFFEFQDLQSFCGYLLAGHRPQLENHYKTIPPVGASLLAPTGAEPIVTDFSGGTASSIEALWQAPPNRNPPNPSSTSICSPAAKPPASSSSAPPRRAWNARPMARADQSCCWAGWSCSTT
jgi:acyl carrier protein